MNDAHQKNGDFEFWSFPPLENGTDTLTVFNEEQIAQESAPSHDLVEEEFALQLPEENQTLNEKISYLDSLGSEIKAHLLEFDSTVLTNIITLIKKSVKKIILKEISINEHVMQEMIGNSLAFINKENEACVIDVSEEDYPKLVNANSQNHINYQINPSLDQGDFIIKSKLSELEAVLEKRLDKLFEI